MCTVVILFRPDHDWPLLLAANRDEMADRPWKSPQRHWPDRTDVVAGLDETAGGTWLGLNDFGVAAAVLNRPGTLGPEASLRSRGELPLDALDHATALDATDSLRHLDGRAFRPFNLVIADRDGAYVLESDGTDRPLAVTPLPAGLHMITAHGLNAPASARAQRYRPLFQAAAPPSPETDDWTAWTALLADRAADSPDGPESAMTVVSDTGFGTVSSSLIALRPPLDGNRRDRWLFCPARPLDMPYAPVDLEG